MVCTHVEIVSATYASNCGTPTQLTKIGAACDGKVSCEYNFSWFADPGFDPAPGCPKDLTVEYVCADSYGGETPKSAYAQAEAQQVKLECGCE